jgi:hypothetical protein
MAESRLSSEQFDALDRAAWDALGGKCACPAGSKPCVRDLAQMDILAWALANEFDNGDVMIEEWKKHRALRLEFPGIFRAKWPEGEA